LPSEYYQSEGLNLPLGKSEQRASPGLSISALCVWLADAPSVRRRARSLDVIEPSVLPELRMGGGQAALRVMLHGVLAGLPRLWLPADGCLAA
jgi:hypothetical protein